MKNFKYLMFAGIAVSTLSLNAQVVDGSLGYYRDALLFGQTSSTYGNTARMQGIGGAQTSLGADISAAGANPAGLGMYNRSVFSFTPSINAHNSNANFLGGEISTYRNNFNFANMGVVFNNNKGDFTSEKFKGGSFAITLGRTNNFNNEVSYQGRNTNSSITDYLVEDANAFGADFSDPQYLADYAYGQFLIENADGYLFENGNDGRTYIYPDGDFDGYTSLVGRNSFDQFFPRQAETIRTSGGQYSLNLAWGGNYDDKIYFGGGINFESIDYTQRKTYTEDGFANADGVQDDLLNELRVINNLNIEGSGIGFNAGIIARPISIVTLGVSYKSPTYWSLDEESDSRLITNWNSNYSYFDGTNSAGDSLYRSLGSYDETGPLFISQYNLRTPARLNLGATVFLGKAGFISGDVEFVDYTGGQLKSNDFNVVADNQTINSLFARTVNYRLGAEFRYDNFRFRGGYAFFGDPYNNNTAFDASVQNLSVGVGYRTRDYFVDLAVMNRKGFDAISPYSLEDGTEPIANITNQSTNVSATIGFNF
ncbi:MAG: hypothetical protein JXR10_11070 [Cyclobacteriaceae bacterium]